MSFWAQWRMPAEYELLIGFYDLTGYQRYAEKTDAVELLGLMAGYFVLTGTILREAGGYLVKTMGDAGLAVFPAERTDAGVLAFREIRRQGNAWLTERGYPAHVYIKLHVGRVAVGRVGDIVDVYGKVVNTAAVLASKGLAMTPDVFRRLTPETRQLFKKHTPPISYIASEDFRP